MLAFFHATEDVPLVTNYEGFLYEHDIKGSPNNGSIPIDKIYVTTPDDFLRILKYSEDVLKNPNLFRIINPKDIKNTLPVNLNSKKDLAKTLGDLKSNNEINIAITNGFSNAFGDNLIGMKALNLLKKELTKYFDEDKINFILLQLNPAKLHPINSKNPCKTFVLPIPLSHLKSCDAYYDFGSLLLMNGFSELPMIDFFIKELSVGDIAPEHKRMEYPLTPESLKITNMLMKHVRKKAKKRPILMFHQSSSSIIRSIDEKNYIRLVNEIIKESDYFVVTTIKTNFKHKRFMCLNKFSTSIDDFAAIISQMDKIVTVDTVTYHLADVFDVPTVVLFTGIEPDVRCNYYPNVKGLSLVDKDSPFYGKHKSDKLDQSDQEMAKKTQSEIKKIWSNLSANYFLKEL